MSSISFEHLQLDEEPTNSLEFPNQRTLLIDIIHSYLFFALNTAQYEGVEPEDIGKIWVHINSSLLRGDTYQEYRYGLGSNPPAFTYEEYSKLLEIFTRYGPKL